MHHRNSIIWYNINMYKENNLLYPCCKVIYPLTAVETNTVYSSQSFNLGLSYKRYITCFISLLPFNRAECNYNDSLTNIYKQVIEHLFMQVCALAFFTFCGWMHKLARLPWGCCVFMKPIVWLVYVLSLNSISESKHVPDTGSTGHRKVSFVWWPCQVSLMRHFG